MRRQSRKLIRCACILSAVTLVLFAAVIATSAKERPHTFRDRDALKTAGERILADLACVDEIMDPSEKVVEQKAKVAQAVAVSGQKQEAAASEKADAEKFAEEHGRTDDEEWAEDEDWSEDDEWTDDEDELSDEEDWSDSDEDEQADDEDEWSDEEDWSDDEDGSDDEDWSDDDGSDEVQDSSGWNLSYDYEEQYSADDLRYLGVIYAGDFRWTWYSQNVLPGGGLNIPGRHVDENGYICDENDRICLASSDLEWGTIVTTPFGKEGCIYDCGCASGTLDVYVDF